MIIHLNGYSSIVCSIRQSVSLGGARILRQNISEQEMRSCPVIAPIAGVFISKLDLLHRRRRSERVTRGGSTHHANDPRADWPGLCQRRTVSVVDTSGNPARLRNRLWLAQGNCQRASGRIVASDGPAELHRSSLPDSKHRAGPASKSDGSLDS